MDRVAGQSKSKLWLGFGIMGLSVVVWMLWVKFAMGPMLAMPEYRPGASVEEIRAALKDRPQAEDMMTGMLVGYGISGIVFVGGMVVTTMGLIDYAAEVRRRG